MCTYMLDRDNKQNGLVDLGEAKWGLTRCAMENRCRSAQIRAPDDAKINGDRPAVSRQLGDWAEEFRVPMLLTPM
jgi:hypothetical protein